MKNSAKTTFCPTPFDRAVAEAVADAVAKEAKRAGLARI
jgi:malic enzyme